jgi:hypothetical protein
MGFKKMKKHDLPEHVKAILSDQTKRDFVFVQKSVPLNTLIHLYKTNKLVVMDENGSKQGPQPKENFVCIVFYMESFLEYGLKIINNYKPKISIYYDDELKKLCVKDNFLWFAVGFCAEKRLVLCREDFNADLESFSFQDLTDELQRKLYYSTFFYDIQTKDIDLFLNYDLF